MRFIRVRVIGLGLIATLTASLSFAGGVSDFSRYAKYEHVSISPKGTYLAITHREDDSEVLSIITRSKLEHVSSTRFRQNIGISDIYWVSEERLLIQPTVRFPAQWDFKAPTGEIIGIDTDGKNFEMLFGYRAGEAQVGSHLKKQEYTNAAGRIIDLLPDDPKHVIVETIGYGVRGTYNHALRMHVGSGKLARLARSPLRNGRFMTDHEHRVTIVSGQNYEGAFELHRREGTGEFKLVMEQPLQEGSFYPVAPRGASGEFYFADSATVPMEGLVAWDPATEDQRQLFRHDEVDIDRYWLAPDRSLWAVNFTNHYPDWAYPDPTHPLVELHKSLRGTFPKDDVRIISQTDDMQFAVVYVHGPQNPGTYFIFDVAKKVLMHKLPARPWLKTDQLAEMIPMEAKVRDGQTVRAYLTLPPGQERDLPMVVLVHGGPHQVADRWDFDSEVQLLAANGYAVLQVNYRGSGGRGGTFQALGYGRWGREMQDDITDVVNYVISEGTADEKRICISGASYGGYAALVGAYRDPDLYRCAIGYAGIYDLPLLFDRGDIQRVLSGVNYLKLAVGRDEADMRARSPVFNAEKIKAAVMLVHGKLDQRAPIQHAERMRTALNKAGNEPKWLVKKREGHGFFNEQNRTELYTEMLAFLDQHLKQR